MRRFSSLRTALAGAAFTLAAMAGLTQATPAAAQQKTLKAVVHADLKILDPTWTTIYITNRYGFLVYDTLYAFDSKFEPKPQMVESHTVSDDKLTWTFTLRPGLAFHDGQPVTSADVVASLKRWMTKISAGQFLAKYTAAVEAVDPKTFRIVLKQPFGMVLESLGNPSTAFIMPERVASVPPTEQITASVGSGPFRMLRDEWRPGNKAVFVKNEAYRPRAEKPDYLSGGKIPKLDRIEWMYIPDANTTLNALLNGEIDYFEAPPLDFVRLLRDSPDVTVLNIDKLGVQGLIRPNSLYPPFNNYKGRQALLHLINQEEYMQAIVGDPSLSMKFCGAFFLCNSANATEVGSEPLRKPDYEKAKQLLKEAGYQGEKLVLLNPTDRPQYSAGIMVLAEGLKRAGAAVELQASDWSTISVRRARKDPPDKGGYHLFITTQGGPGPTVPSTNAWFNSRCERANPGWACDPELDKLIDSWATQLDPVKRHAMIETIQRRAYESVPYVVFGQFFQPIAFRKNVTGVLESGVPVYWNIEKK
ncbi:MAG: ABC transporter substrate-binding protein [Acetobacteraceae bacterium]